MELSIQETPQIKQACLVIADLQDGETALNVVFGGGFDKNSPAHCALRKVLEMLDNMGMAIIEPMEDMADNAHAAIPAPMLLDGNGDTIISGR